MAINNKVIVHEIYERNIMTWQTNLGEDSKKWD